MSFLLAFARGVSKLDFLLAALPLTALEAGVFGMRLSSLEAD